MTTRATDLTPAESEALCVVTRTLEELEDPERQVRVMIHTLLRLAPAAHALLAESPSRSRSAKRAVKVLRDQLAAMSAKTKPQALVTVVDAIRPILGPFDRIVLAVDDDATGGIVLATVTSDGTDKIAVVHTPNAHRTGRVLLDALYVAADEDLGEQRSDPKGES